MSHNNSNVKREDLITSEQRKEEEEKGMATMDGMKPVQSFL